ncbi:MAG: discoidin domain-containing protein [Tannerella sp.]|jgi:hypothetical protein|nr:discoidin domain-containing protein [Tannerella sp.]
MNKLKYYIILIFTLSLVFSCGDMMKIHEEYIEGGEIVYAPRVDTSMFIAGKERALFRFYLYNSPNVKSVDVYWNSKLDSMIIPVTPTAGLDSFDIFIPNLPEKSYTFDFRTSDLYGNKSLWETAFCNTYGAVYETTISNRRIREVVLTEYGGEINWLTGGDGIVRVEVKYKKADGSTATVYTAANETKTLCPDPSPNSTFEYRSAFIPEGQSIDTFFVDWVSPENVIPGGLFLYDRSLWTVIACSDQTASDGGGMTTVIDGDVNSYWHSQWDNGNAPVPHWVMIDFGKELYASKFDLYRRVNNTDNKNVELYLGNSPDADNGEWTKVGETVITDNKMEVNSLDKSVTGRYLKIVFVNSNRDPFTNLAEIYMYGGSL